MNLMCVSGTDDFRRDRLVRNTAYKASQGGSRMMSLEGGTGLSSVLDSTGVLFDESVVVVLTEPEKEPLEVLTRQLSKPNKDVLVILSVEGSVKQSSKLYKDVIANLPKNAWKEYELPAEYKRGDYAVDFAIAESRSMGTPLDSALASALVDRVGTDLGVISFEIMKASVITPKGSSISPETLRSVVTSRKESTGVTIVDAVAARSASRILREFDRVQSYYGREDPTMAVCGQYMAPTFLRWVQACSGQDQGLKPSTVAEIVGMNPWVWENKILPPALTWGMQGCVDLVSAVAKAQEGVLKGENNPWLGLQTRILKLLKSKPY